MLVSTRQAFTFKQQLGTSPTDGTAIYGETFRLPLTEEPLPAPDWIKETPLYKLAMQDGALKVYEGGSDLDQRH